MVIVELRGWHLGAIGRAAALAFARVLGFATVFAALTPTIALAGVLTLASMLFFHLAGCWCLVGLCSKMRAGEEIRRLNRCGGAGQQTCQRCTSD